MTTRAIGALRQIMLNDDNEAVPLRRRVEAAEHLLDYEGPPEVVEETKEFLLSVAEGRETLVETRLDALKLLRRVEARKVVPAKAVVRDDNAHIEGRRMLETLKRKALLIEAGCWPLPKGWNDDLCSPDYVPIDDEEEPVETDLASALRTARLAAQKRAGMSSAIDVTAPVIPAKSDK